MSYKNKRVTNKFNRTVNSKKHSELQATVRNWQKGITFYGHKQVTKTKWSTKLKWINVVQRVHESFTAAVTTARLNNTSEKLTSDQLTAATVAK